MWLGRKNSGALLAVVLLLGGGVACTAAPARVQLDLRSFHPQRAALEAPVDELTLAISAPDFEQPVSLSFDLRGLELEALNFDLEIKSGSNRTFTVTAVKDEEGTRIPTYWGQTSTNLEPAVDVEVTIPAFPAGEVRGTVSIVNTVQFKPGRAATSLFGLFKERDPIRGQTALPAGLAVLFENATPRAPALSALSTPVSGNSYGRILPVGTYTTTVTFGGIADTRFEAKSEITVEQGTVQQSPDLRLTPVLGCRPDLGIFIDEDGDGVACHVDCDETNANCTNDCTDNDGDGYCVDHDCDDTVESGADCTTGCASFYPDRDGDGLGDAAGAVERCSRPANAVATGTDCDDAATSCSDDCTTDEDNDGRPDCKDGCFDFDHDGYGTITPAADGCVTNGGAVLAGVEGIELSPESINIGGTIINIGDGTDTGSDTLNEVLSALLGGGSNNDMPFPGGEEIATQFVLCDVGPACLGPDCIDVATNVYPGAPELVANNLDEDCDNMELCYVDGDNDGLGGSGVVASTAFLCDAPGIANNSDDCNDNNPYNFTIDLDGDGISICGGDCDDQDPTVHPAGTDANGNAIAAATEICDRKDNDCNNVIDDTGSSQDPETALDSDGDGVPNCDDTCPTVFNYPGGTHPVPTTLTFNWQPVPMSLSAGGNCMPASYQFFLNGVALSSDPVQVDPSAADCNSCLSESQPSLATTTLAIPPNLWKVDNGNTISFARNAAGSGERLVWLEVMEPTGSPGVIGGSLCLFSQDENNRCSRSSDSCGEPTCTGENFGTGGTAVMFQGTQPDIDNDGIGDECDCCTPGACGGSPFALNPLWPAKTELCNDFNFPPLDLDCDGLDRFNDPDCPSSCISSNDMDFDGYYKRTGAGDPCSPPAGLEDCVDSDKYSYPGGPESFVIQTVIPGKQQGGGDQGAAPPQDPSTSLVVVNQCADGIDNNCDGLTDHQSPGCAGVSCEGRKDLGNLVMDTPFDSVTVSIDPCQIITNHPPPTGPGSTPCPSTTGEAFYGRVVLRSSSNVASPTVLFCNYSNEALYAGIIDPSNCGNFEACVVNPAVDPLACVTMPFPAGSIAQVQGLDLVVRTETRLCPYGAAVVDPNDAGGTPSVQEGPQAGHGSSGAAPMSFSLTLLNPNNPQQGPACAPAVDAFPGGP